MDSVSDKRAGVGPDTGASDAVRSAATTSGPRVPVWDLPLRLFHWLLVMLVITSFISGSIGGMAMQVHKLSGYGILFLLLFRLGWGFAGGRHARFAGFVRSPAVVWRYALALIRTDTPRFTGHNPLGGWSVLAMLGALLFQAGSGLFANDDILTEGPLAGWVGKDVSDALTAAHHLNANLIIFLAALHVGAVLFHLIFKRENLITPMITGFKVDMEAQEASPAKLWSAAAIAILAAGCVYLLVR